MLEETPDELAELKSKAASWDLAPGEAVLTTVGLLVRLLTSGGGGSALRANVARTPSAQLRRKAASFVTRGIPNASALNASTTPRVTVGG